MLLTRDEVRALLRAKRVSVADPDAAGLEAALQAQAEATRWQAPRDVWQHVGDGTVPGRGTYLLRNPQTLPPPKFGRWIKVLTVEP